MSRPRLVVREGRTDLTDEAAAVAELSQLRDSAQATDVGYRAVSWYERPHSAPSDCS
ncbi:MAG: hypothetical protein ABJB12_13345 [Pseudomonadota bacterium]